MTSEERLLTPAEIASLFRVDPKTVTRWAKAGKLSVVRTPGGHRRYRASEVQALLQDIGTGRGQPVAAGVGLESASSGPRGDSPDATLTASRLAAPSPPPKPQVPAYRAHPPQHQSGRSGQAVAIDLYLDTDDEDVFEQVTSAVARLAAVLGFAEPEQIDLVRGSFWWRARSAARRALTSKELSDRLVKVERSLELVRIDAVQADVDTKEAQAVGQLMESLADVPQACLRVGSLLLVKYPGAHGPVVLARTLSQPEIRLLERCPEIQRDPPRVMEALATALASADLVAYAPQEQQA